MNLNEKRTFRIEIYVFRTDRVVRIIVHDKVAFLVLSEFVLETFVEESKARQGKVELGAESLETCSKFEQTFNVKNWCKNLLFNYSNVT